jgi:hypothetical protein
MPALEVLAIAGDAVVPGPAAPPGGVPRTGPRMIAALRASRGAVSAMPEPVAGWAKPRVRRRSRPTGEMMSRAAPVTPDDCVVATAMRTATSTQAIAAARSAVRAGAGAVTAATDAARSTVRTAAVTPSAEMATPEVATPGVATVAAAESAAMTASATSVAAAALSERCRTGDQQGSQQQCHQRSVNHRTPSLLPVGVSPRRFSHGGVPSLSGAQGAPRPRGETPQAA